MATMGDNPVGSASYDKLLGVQDLDLALTQLRHRLATHPLRAELASLLTQAAEIDTRRAEIESRRHDLDRELKRLADEVVSIEDKRARTEAKLYDGTVTATKELLALQDESRSLLDRQHRIEDDELELMESLEEVGTEVDAVTGEAADVATRLDRVEAELAAVTADIEAEIAEMASARDEAAASVPAELLDRYESLAPEFDGAPLARFTGGRCDGCHMQLSAVAVDRIAKTPEDQVVTCEECGRLLVR